MTLQLSENQSRLLGYAFFTAVAVLILVWLFNQIAATAAYRKAMLAIADSVKKGSTVSVQVANFNHEKLSADGKPNHD